MKGRSVIAYLKRACCLWMWNVGDLSDFPGSGRHHHHHRCQLLLCARSPFHFLSDWMTLTHGDSCSQTSPHHTTRCSTIRMNTTWGRGRYNQPDTAGADLYSCHVNNGAPSCWSSACSVTRLCDDNTVCMPLIFMCTVYNLLLGFMSHAALIFLPVILLVRISVRWYIIPQSETPAWAGLFSVCQDYSKTQILAFVQLIDLPIALN